MPTKTITRRSDRKYGKKYTRKSVSAAETKRAPATGSLNASSTAGRTPDWTATADTALVNMVLMGATAYDIAEHLGRHPLEIVLRLGSCSLALQALQEKHSPVRTEGADDDHIEDFSFAAGSEEHEALLDLALCAVPLDSALLWCSAHPARPSAQELRALRHLDGFGPELAFSREQGLWINYTGDTSVEGAFGSSFESDFDAITQLSAHALKNGPDGVRSVVSAFLNAFDAPRPQAVLACVSGRQSVPTQAQRLAPAPARGGPALPAPASDWRSGSSSSKAAPRRGKWPRRGGSYKKASPSYPSMERTSGKPFVDTRSAAERAWELKTHW